MTEWQLADSYPRDLGGYMKFSQPRARHVGDRVEIVRGIDALADLFEVLIVEAAEGGQLVGADAVAAALEARIELVPGVTAALADHIEVVHFVRVRQTEVDLAFTAERK